MSVTERRDAGSRPDRGDTRPGPAGHFPWVVAGWLLAGVGVLVIALVVGGGRPKPTAPGCPTRGC